MSAIFGAIDFANEKDFSDLGAKLVGAYGKYKIDRMESLWGDNYYMGCGIQYFNVEAKNERLPYYNDSLQVAITADCVIDNRKSLITELELADTVADGDIIIAAYSKWGMDLVNHLRGVFAFVVYDSAAKEAYLAVDHFAQRCLMYLVDGSKLYFSTLLFPILESVPYDYQENERWFVDSVSLRAPVMITEPKETPIKGIMKVVSGTYIKVSLNQGGGLDISECGYYNPVSDAKVDKHITLKQSERLAREVMTESVNNILRNDVKIAAQLSSGLDSSTVASIAAINLEKKGQKLYSYTSVPDSEAGLENKGMLIFDERAGVEYICSEHQNIEPTFVDSKGRSFLKEVDDILDIWELPCKSQQNAIWIDEIYKQASEKGCKIILNGATGNTTLSAGDMVDNAYYYLTHLRPFKALRMLDPVKNAGYSRKRVIKAVAKNWIGYYGWYFNKEAKDCYSNILTRKDIGEKYNMTKRFHREFAHFYPFTTEKKTRKNMYMVNANAQIGEIETKASLAYGILPRDPIRNVDVIQMCLSLPMECFSSTDYDRRLVRAGMAGIVPERIRKDMFHRGRQSGDNIFRIAKAWPEVKDAVKKDLYDIHTLDYLDKARMDELFEKLDKGIENNEDLDVMLVSDIYSFARYLKRIHSITVTN